MIRRNVSAGDGQGKARELRAASSNRRGGRELLGFRIARRAFSSGVQSSAHNGLWPGLSLSRHISMATYHATGHSAYRRFGNRGSLSSDAVPGLGNRVSARTIVSASGVPRSVSQVKLYPTIMNDSISITEMIDYEAHSSASAQRPARSPGLSSATGPVFSRRVIARL